MTIFLMLAAEAAAVAGASIPATPTSFGAIAPLDEAVLDKATAREDTSIVAQSDQVATASHNVVTGNSVTGAVTFDGNAFQNSQGLTLINANSGNNSAINASLNVTINFGPTPTP